MKLISLSDYVLQLWDDKLMSEIGIRAINYAQFLKQKIKLEMFVPCDENGNVLEEPEKYGWLQNVGSRNSYATEQECIDCETFHLAKQNVLFEGFFVKKNDDGILCLFHKDYEWEFAEIEPDFVWGRTNEFTIEDIVNCNPRLSFFVLNENAVSRLS